MAKLPINPMTRRPSDMAGAILDSIPDEKPSMGDPEFVDQRIREMFDKANNALATNPNPPAAILALVDEYTKVFRADNPAYIQTWSQLSQDKFLRSRGLGTNDPDDGLPVKALVAETMRRFIKAATDYHEQKTDDEQLQFAIDTAAEDFVFLIRGLDNPAD